MSYLTKNKNIIMLFKNKYNFIRFANHIDFTQRMHLYAF